MDYKPQSLSVIILAYNEERHLTACLDAIALQTEMPDQVIVVDNNSTDQSAAIARTYPFVTLIEEHRQGMIPARNAGFAVATGGILARIDADAILSTTWVQRVKQDFSSDPKLGGVSGLADAALFFTGPWHGTFWSRIYFLANDSYFRFSVLWGANMAIRREVWESIRSQACTDDNVVHEDLDISLLTLAHGWHILRDTRLTITTNGREYLEWPKVKEYTARRANTKRYHQAQGTWPTGNVIRISRWKAGLIMVVMALPVSIYITASYLLHVVRFSVNKNSL